MRIGIDARPLTLPHTGIGRYTRELVVRLARRSELSLHLYSHAPIAKEGSEFDGCLVRAGTVTQPLHSSLFAQFVFPRWINRDELNVFWSPRHHLPMFTRVPTVLTVHDLVWRKAPETMAPPGRTLERMLMPPSLRRAARIITVSQSTARDLIELDPSLEPKLTVVPCGALLSSPRPDSTPAPTAPFMLFVGTFEPRKNLWRILSAFKRFTELTEFPHSLVLAGNPGWRVDVEAMVRQLDLVARVDLRLNPDDAALSALYAECDFLVMPSLYEGFGLPLLEAMGFGKPVITSDRSSMPEVAGQAGLLVDPESIDGICSAMQALADDRGRYRDLSSAAIRQASQFSWDTAAKATQRVLEDAAR
jgi:glycosyltransferase involved in cell wall biosynthesis